MTISGRTRLVGVIGHPIGHSLSPAMHNAAFQALGLDYCYVPFDVLPGSVTAALDGAAALGIVGLNVTIPHKPAVYAEMDELSLDARAVEAVNTVELRDGKRIGHNTDGEGFARSLEHAGVPAAGRRITLLGAGGAARAVAETCVQRGCASVTILSRRPEQASSLAQRLQAGPGSSSAAGSPQPTPEIAAGTLAGGKAAVAAADIVVQCTPVGMHPHEDDPLPIPAEWLGDGMVVYDLIYNPEETRLLAAARERGARTLNGVEMLVCQGAVAFEIWTGIFPPLDIMRAALIQELWRSRS